jgi:hypothetical protein
VDDLRDDVTLRFMLEADVEGADAEALTGCGTTAEFSVRAPCGTITAVTTPKWDGRGSNPRPKDYESDPQSVL